MYACPFHMRQPQWSRCTFGTDGPVVSTAASLKAAHPMNHIPTHTCPAAPALNAEPGYSTGVPSPTPVPADCLTLLISGLAAATEALTRAAVAMEALAQTNALLIQAMAEGEGMDDMPPSTYLDGTPRR